MTLIEVMIVMVIMAMVATGASIVVMKQLEEAKKRQSRTNAVAVASAVSLFLRTVGVRSGPGRGGVGRRVARRFTAKPRQTNANFECR